LSEISLSKTWLPKTIWLTLFCLVGLGPVIAIKLTAPPASSVAGPTPNRSKPDQSKMELAFAPNETAKSDRLELARPVPEPDIIVPAANPAPAETPSPSAEIPSTNAITSSTDVGTASSTSVETASSTRAGTASTSVETAPSTTVETVVKKAAGRNWKNANARLLPAAPPHRRTKSKEPEPSAAADHPPSERAEAWHCRQDAMGSILRSLDLSPRCNL
jgi:hypothetical protein